MTTFLFAIYKLDVPQLEDMSEELERLKSLRTKHSVDIQTIGSKSPVNVNVSKSEQQKSNSIAKMKGQGDSKSFGGFKKGFLVSSSDSKCQEKKTSHHPQKLSAPPTKMTGTSSKDIPLIKPKPEAKSSLEFPEVQEAMKESFPFLQSQGMKTSKIY